MATIDDFGGTGQSLNSPALGGPDGWAAAVRDAIRNLQDGLPEFFVTSETTATGTAPEVTISTEDGVAYALHFLLPASPSGDFQVGTVQTGPADAELVGSPDDGWTLNLVLPPVGDESIGVGALIPGAAGAFDVRSFGAVGDGVTDDSVAIRAAMAAATAAGHALHFPTGTYIVSKEGGGKYWGLNPPAGAQLQGPGTIKLADGSQGSVCVFRIDNDDVTVDDVDAHLWALVGVRFPHRQRRCDR